MRLTIAALALAATLAGPASAAPCADFEDVPSTSAFCANVAWIKNRGVTLGCADGFYCPDEPVTRLQMAAFMARMGAALTPTTVFFEYTVSSKNLNNDNVIVCQTEPVGPATYPRSARVDGYAYLYYAASKFSYALYPAYSTDGGSSWTDINTWPIVMQVEQVNGSAAFISKEVPLSTQASYLFGLRVERYIGTADIAGGWCHIRATVASAISP